MTKKYIKRVKQYIDIYRPVNELVIYLQKILKDHPEAFIGTSDEYEDWGDYIYWERPMTSEEIKEDKIFRKKLKDDQKQKKLKDDMKRKEMLQDLYKEHFGIDLEL